MWLANRFIFWPLSNQKFKICPICAGVSGTWLWLIIGYWLDYEVDLIIPAILMGGSIVGIAYQVEKRLNANKSPLLWKAWFIPLGFVAVFVLLMGLWLYFVILLTALLIITIIFASDKFKSMLSGGKGGGHNNDDPAVKELEDKMKNCC